MSDEWEPPPIQGSIDTTAMQRSMSDIETRTVNDLARVNLHHTLLECDSKEQLGDGHSSTVRARNNNAEERPVEISGLSNNSSVAYTSASTPSVSSSKSYSRSQSNVSEDSGLGAKSTSASYRPTKVHSRVHMSAGTSVKSNMNIRSLKHHSSVVSKEKPVQNRSLQANEDESFALGRFESVDLKTVHICELCKTSIANEILLHPCKCMECEEAYVHPTCLTSMRDVVKLMCYNPCPCAAQKLTKKSHRHPHSSTPIMGNSLDADLAGKKTAWRAQTQPLGNVRPTSPKGDTSANRSFGSALHPQGRASSTSPQRSFTNTQDDEHGPQSQTTDHTPKSRARRQKSGNTKRMLSSGARYLKHGVSSTVSGVTSAVSGTFGASEKEIDRQRAQMPTDAATHNASFTNPALASEDGSYTSTSKNNSFTNSSYTGSTNIISGGGKDEPSIASSKGMAFTVSMYSAYSPLQAERARQAQEANKANALAQSYTQAQSDVHLHVSPTTRPARGTSPERAAESEASLASQSFDHEISGSGRGERGVNTGPHDQGGARKRAVSDIRKRSADSGSGTGGTASYTAKGEAAKPNRRHTPQFGKATNTPLTVTQSATVLSSYSTSDTTTNIALNSNGDMSQDIMIGSRVVDRQSGADGLYVGANVNDRSRSVSPLHKARLLTARSTAPMSSVGYRMTPPRAHKTPPFVRKAPPGHPYERQLSPTVFQMERTKSNPLHNSSLKHHELRLDPESESSNLGAGTDLGNDVDFASQQTLHFGQRKVGARHRRSLSAQSDVFARQLAKVNTTGSIMSTIDSDGDLGTETGESRDHISVRENSHTGKDPVVRRRSGSRTTGLTNIGETTIKEFAQKRSGVHNQTTVEELNLKIDFLQNELGAQSMVLIELQQVRELHINNWVSHLWSGMYHSTRI
ncbi:hypothetical protein, variant [Sphaeroforma arctica JP610]|uniref:Uncharacterized protein n=1 Tax=Sphaeroforma arctica JP610 TaxID=667725 RepID=A0A0L0FFI0_9EUKA|nr:hypothetical protein, variant [Sphaeroforma arctica JP610]KNC75221.1 hypothetical protein, variant [Sphaeroforma arctica JP610]|eukprot:XP_014149123.1 hypothetical protein, variant [Sphaeroforma arctica JP610]